MSTPITTGVEQAAASLARLAPQMDPHILLSMLDFYEQKGVDVKASRAKLLSMTKLPEVVESNESLQRTLEERFKKAFNAATPIMNKYFSQNDSTDAEYVLKLSEKELAEKRANSTELTIRSFETAETVEEKLDGSISKEEQLRQLKAKYEDGVKSDALRSVEYKQTAQFVDADGKPISKWNVSTKETRGDIPESHMNSLLDVATLCFETGRYADAEEIFTLARIVLEGSANYAEKFRTVLWGLFAASILSKHWGKATVALRLIRIHILGDDSDEPKDDGPMFGVEDVSTTQRNWAMHWSLFVYFKGGESLSEGFLDHVFKEFGSNMRDRKVPNQRTIELVAPHLLRYVAAACLLNRTKRAALYNTLRLSRLCFEYSDSLLQFVEQLVGQVNFDAAFALLPAIASEVEHDFFLAGLKQQILDSAHKLIFEQYLRTHKTVSISTVARRLFPDQECDTDAAKAKAELWMANLIRESKVVAKIDSVGGKIEVSSGQSSFEKRMYEKLNFAQRSSYH